MNLRTIAFYTMVIMALSCGSSGGKTIADKEGRLEVDKNVQLYYRTVGQGEPIIVIHGGPSLDQSYLSPHLDELAKDHEVTYFDQRTCGKSSASPTPSQLSIDLFIEDIESIRKKTGSDKVHLLAHSFGGFLAMKYALKHQEHLKSLMLISSNPANSDLTVEQNKLLEKRFTEEDKERRRAILKSGDLEGGSIEAMKELYMLTFKYQFVNPTKVKELTFDLPPDIMQRSRTLFMNISDDLSYDLTLDLAKIDVPTLVMYGDDEPALKFGAEHLKNSIKGAEYLVIEDSGHFPFIEQKDAFFKSIRSFIARNK